LDEAALGADRHDHRVLHHLRLDQAEHLGAEVLAPVRPAQAAARDRAEAQVHALDARRVDEDLELRPRLRQVGDRLRVELERQVRLAVRVGARWEVVGAQGGLDQGQVGAQDAVLVEAGHLVERARSPRPARSASRAAPGPAGCPAAGEPGLEQLHQQPGDVGLGEKVVSM
jgi:hypothetical protein